MKQMLSSSSVPISIPDLFPQAYRLVVVFNGGD